ncbi:unspecific monooxygenase, partial [Ostertagia ostertagi]
NAVGNVINQLAFGFVRPHEDNEIIRFQLLLNEVTSNYLLIISILMYIVMLEVFEHFNNPKMLLLDIMPFLRHFDRILGFGIETTLHGNDAILEFIQKDHQLRSGANKLSRCLSSRNSQKRKEGIKDEFTEKQCIVAIYDLYSAGLETICNHTHDTVPLQCLNYPHIQEKIHHEIDDAIGRERDVTMDDQKILPYTCAFLQEVYRAGYVLYVNFLRMTQKDVNCEGYQLKCGTRVIPQFQSVHMDEDIYPRPELIIPERHLKNGQFIKDDRINGFSLGKRACLGENLARMEVFMFFTSLMQKFRFEPEGLYPPELKLLTSTFRAPLPYKIRVIDRCSK